MSRLYSHEPLFPPKANIYDAVQVWFEPPERLTNAGVKIRRAFQTLEVHHRHDSESDSITSGCSKDFTQSKPAVELSSWYVRAWGDFPIRKVAECVPRP